MNTSTVSPAKTPFKPTEAMIEAARAVFIAMAHLALVRPMVLKYQADILAKGQWSIRADFAERLGSGVVLDPSLTYLLSNEDLEKFDAACKRARDTLGLAVENDEFCPLFVAENAVLARERDLIAAFEPVTKIGCDNACTLDAERYGQFVSLTLQLVTPFVGDADAILNGKHTLAFIVARGNDVGVKEYRATDQEAEVVDAAVANFTHLIRNTGQFLQTKHLSFADLAVLIEKNYSMDEPRVAETVSILRRVHYRHAIHRAPGRPESDLARRHWVESLRIGDSVEVPYSQAAEDIVQMRVVGKSGGWLRLLPNGRANISENWILACAVNGWTNPYRIAIQPPGTAAMQAT